MQYILEAKKKRFLQPFSRQQQEKIKKPLGNCCRVFLFLFLLLYGYPIKSYLHMVEISDEEFTIIKNFIVDTLGANVDWENAPEEFKNEYTQVLQIINAFGAEAEASTQPEMAAPG